MTAHHDPDRKWLLAIWLAAVLLFLLHQDLWFWSDESLVCGFLPIGLAYHALYSIAAACLWALAVRFAWPRTLEDWASEGREGGAGKNDE